MNPRYRPLIVFIVLASAIYYSLPSQEVMDAEHLNINNLVIVEVFRPTEEGTVKVYHHESTNVITDVGLHVIQRLIGGQSNWQWSASEGGNNLYYAVAGIRYIALSTDDTGVDASHSSWQPVDGSYPSDVEITGGGLARKQGTYTGATSYTPGAGGSKGSLTFTISTVFTVDAGQSFTGVQKAGLFSGVYNTNDGSTSSLRISALVAENTFDPVNLSGGDSISITWRITI